MADDGLDHLAPWLEGYLQRLAPAARRKMTRKLGKALRDANAKRIRDNVQPDGSAMEPRKSQRDRRGRLRKRKGRMFPKAALARNLRAQTSADEIVIRFRPLVARIAEVHHFGEEAPVDPDIRASIRVRYAQRRLLGLSARDQDVIEQSALNLLDGK
ncbi:phage virion morphogenesis protein [Novosphingobium sp.]|uniref:phage virion morphogenesis protein n=1 Tax=Novosphingobium sp. TaxID=1874826 RepID=UPI002FDD27D8